MGMKLLKTIISICSMTMIADVLGATTTTGRNSILLAENEEGKHHIRGLADTTNNVRVLSPLMMMKMPSKAIEMKQPSMSKPPSMPKPPSMSKPPSKPKPPSKSKPPSYSKSPSVSKPPSSKPMMGMMGMIGMMEMMGMMGMMGKPMREKPNMIGKPK